MTNPNDLYDRNDQIDWLYGQVDTVLSNDMFGAGQEHAQILIEFWEENVILPKWYDKFDRGLLIRLVGDALKK